MWPIGIGTRHRIIGKAICSATRADIESLCGIDQLCGGVKCGIEGAIHALNDLYSQNSTSPDWGVLLVDALNAFNSLNHATLLWNVHILWPRCSQFFSTPTTIRLLWLLRVLINSSIAEKGLHRGTHSLCSSML